MLERRFMKFIILIFSTFIFLSPASRHISHETENVISDTLSFNKSTIFPSVTVLLSEGIEEFKKKKLVLQFSFNPFVLRTVAAFDCVDFFVFQRPFITFKDHIFNISLFFSSLHQNSPPIL